MLEIKKTVSEGKAVFELNGRLDTVTAPDLEKELKEIEDTINVGSEAEIRVEDTVNPGVVIKIDDKQMKIPNTMMHVKFYRPEGSSVIEVKTL